MSSKNTLTLSKETYIKKNEQRLLKLSDAYFNNKHFLLGEGVNRDEMNFSTIMDSFLCESNCEINDLINKKIKGGLEPLSDGNAINIINKSSNGGGNTYIVNNYAAGFWDKSVEW